MDDKPSVWAPSERPLTTGELVLIAKSMAAARRAVEELIPIAYVADPALDILLRLYVDDSAGRETTMASLVSAIPVDAAITERWLRALISAGYATTEPRLSDDGRNRVAEMLRAVGRSQWDIQ